MKRFDLETRNEISIVAGFLSAFDEEVISDNDYSLIKNSNVNNVDELRYVSDVVLKSWFLEYTPDNRDKVLNSIDFIVNGEEELIDVVLGEVIFTFGYEIEDKHIFLTRIKDILEEYARKNKEIKRSGDNNN